ncbi:MAG: RsiV family protein [Lachnospiraceae bacterium]|nr:RsiV family protein [Lachnospiraceae bacterium]
MKKTMIWITACLLAAAVTACTKPSGENKGDASLTENSGIGTLPDAEGVGAEGTDLEEEEPVFGGVPYFQDDTGRLVQSEDGYFYGYWGGTLARYDVDTLERTVLYEAGSEQRGGLFCIYGDYVYFLEVPEISPFGKKILLYRVKKDGTDLTLLDENVPDAGELYDGYEYESYLGMDIYEDILYLMSGKTVTCYRLDDAGGVELTDITDTLYGTITSIPQGYYASRSDYYPDRYTVPYCARNFGFIIACSEEGGLGRVAVDSGEWEEIALPEGCTAGVNSLYLTNEAMYLNKDDTLWLRRSMEKGSDWELWYEAQQKLYFCGYDEEGLYFVEPSYEEGTQVRNGAALCHITWDGRREEVLASVLGNKEAAGQRPRGFYAYHDFWVSGDYFYYFAAADGGDGIYRTQFTQAASEEPQLVAIYRKDKMAGTAYIERTEVKAEGDILALPAQFDKLYLYEETEADKKINAFLADLYEEYETYLEGENEEFCAEIREDWEWLGKWVPEELADAEELVQMQDIAECSYDNIRVSISYIDEKYLVLGLMEDSYWFPGAHGMYWYKCYVFDRETGERLAITDLVDNTEEEIMAIAAEYAEMIGRPYHEGQEQTALEPDRFFLTGDGIGLSYDVYELASYAEGATDIVIPFEEFRMKEGF